MSFNLVASGAATTAKGDAKFYDFNASSLKAEDYPHLPSKTIGEGADAKSVPVVKVSPTNILVREYISLADAEASASEKGVSKERFNEVVLNLLNTEERNETVKAARSRVADLKLIPADIADITKDLYTEINIFAEAEAKAGRESLKAKQEKAAAVAQQMQGDPAGLAKALMDIFGVTL